MSASNPGRTPGNPRNGSTPGASGAAVNKKKLLILLGLVAGGLLLWGRLLMQQVPRTVVAIPQGEATANASSGAVPMNSGPGSNPDAPAAATLAASNKSVFPDGITVKIDIPKGPPRDLFALNPTGYARVPKDEPDVKPPEKSPDKPADDKSMDHASAARGLVLQTTILGDQPRAMINGQVLRPGQNINGFMLRKVLPRQVVLEKDGVEVKLQM